MPKIAALITISLFLFSAKVLPFESEGLLTNSSHFSNPPKWLTSTRVNRIADSISNYLEWSIRRVEVQWFYNQSSFQQAHGLGALAMAVSKKNQNRILLGPQVNSNNFDAIFGHELAHVISYQKYKDAIPPWLEEGLANFVAKTGKVDYTWLSKQNYPTTALALTHPFSGSDTQIRFNYMASQALVEMISSKCDFKNLLRLSVGRNMESYLDTYCGIKDLNAFFKKWLTSKTH
jgi:hypothetical protein